MFIDIILTVLRETVEAGVLVSLLLSVAQSLRCRSHWIILGTSLGVIGAYVYASNLHVISDSFDYMGQEVSNGVMHLTIFSLLGWIVAAMARGGGVSIAVLSLVLALALMLEGGELFIFYQAYTQSSETLVPALTSGLVGLLIGASVGVLFYYVIAISNERYTRPIRRVLLYLVAAGMALQGSQMFIQADWLPASQPLWDSSAWVAESSVFGQFVFAVFGYEATPSLVELSAYVLAIVLIYCLSLLLRRTRAEQFAA